MFTFIFILILFLVIFIPSLLLTVIARIVSFFSFGSKKRSERDGAAERNTHRTYQSRDAHDAHAHSQRGKKKQHKKIFGKDEGEYVDFEEIK